MQKLHVGTAGWSISADHAEAFPGPGTHLERYARRLGAVEINSSFYRPHRRTTYERWAASVTNRFQFAIKLPKSITHEARLVGAASLIAEFTQAVGGLGGTLGAILVQLPPSLAYDAAIARAFFIELSAALAAPIACEPRHASWFTEAADADLDTWRIARVAADPPVAAGGDEPGGWRGLTYFRLHGAPRIYYSPYDAAALAAVRTRLAAETVPTWCIFDNTASGAALGNALALG